MTALVRIFGKEWFHVRTAIINKKRYYMAHDCCQILGISNVSLAIKSARGVHNVSQEERTMEQIDEWNKFRTIHLLTLNGVFQLILNNKSAGCRKIKNHIASAILPKSRMLF
jgi:prophage antirepressor-like protein